MMKHLGRRGFIGSLAVLGMGAYVPQHAVATQAMGFDEARHLLSRTSFGILPTEVQSIATLPYQTVVDQMLAVDCQPVTVAPLWVNATPSETLQVRQARAKEVRQARLEARKIPDLKPGQDQFGELAQWWVDEMLASPSPLVERMTLFWHNHFTSAVRKVRYAPALFRQNALFRREAIGNFATLLRQIARDPAMLVYLDGMKSIAQQPNENFARELLELFTLGEGHYTEADVKAAARAFTGWTIDLETGSFVDRPEHHDTGEKSFLGKTGNLSGDDVLTVLLAHPRTAETIVEKLWRELISAKPDGQQVSRLAGDFRASGYEMKPLLRSMLLSSAFRDPTTRGGLIKSPIDLVVGTFRVLGQPPSESPQLPRILRNLGQAPFDPPNVKGWPGGKAWITSRTLLLRQQFVRRMLEGAGLSSVAVQDTAQTMEPLPRNRGSDGSPPEARLTSVMNGGDAATLLRTLLPIRPLDTIVQDGPPDKVLRTAMLDIAYQLK
jgi:uncharacterized protein (DUF1800 family)